MEACNKMLIKVFSIFEDNRNVHDMKYVRCQIHIIQHVLMQSKC
jgi:hypothetical protein